MATVTQKARNIVHLVGTATCTGCKLVLPVTEFRIDRQKNRYRNTRCKTCTKVRDADRKSRNAAHREQAIAEGHVKQCRVCKVEKSIQDFPPHSSNMGGSSHECTTCFNIRHTRWRKINQDHVQTKGRETMRRLNRKKPPEKQAEQSRRWRLKRKYGLTEAALEAMKKSQNSSCAICFVRFGKTAWGFDAMNIDHDHTSGAIRALLCVGCNSGIGYFKDDEDRLLKAAAYVRKHKRID